MAYCPSGGWIGEWLCVGSNCTMGLFVFFFGGGEWANFDQFSAQPRNSQASPNSPMMYFDTAATECHVQPQNS